MEELRRANVDKQGAIDVVASKGAVVVGSLNVSVLALGAIQRAIAFKPAAVDALQVEVNGLALAPKVREDASVGEVWVEVDLLDGLQETAELRTKQLRKSAVPLDFAYSHSLSVAAGSRALQELQKVLRSSDEQEADVYFALKTHGAGGKERELGQGYVNLRQLLRDARNMVGAQVSLAGPQGSAGTLTVSVVALEALKAASRAAVPPSPPPSPPGSDVPEILLQST